LTFLLAIDEANLAHTPRKSIEVTLRPVPRAGDSKNSFCITLPDGEKTAHFIADPHSAPAIPGVFYARPDDPIPLQSCNGNTWRWLVEQYNHNPAGFTLPSGIAFTNGGLPEASQLYKNPAYARLAGSPNIRSFYILSAGWGLVKSTFRLPHYDVTFSCMACAKQPWLYRSPGATGWNDFNQPEPLQYLNAVMGKDYVKRLAILAKNAALTLHFWGTLPAQLPAQWTTLPQYLTAGGTSRQWHYTCADNLQVLQVS
jgi:hypothetical protein